MDPGSRRVEIARGAGAGDIRWVRASCVWMLMMLIETASGIFRELLIAPGYGALRARQLGVLIGSIAVLLITRLLFRWLRAGTMRAQLIVGAFWVSLTLAFEFALGRAMHYPWSRIFGDYDPTQGGFMLLGLAVMFTAPWLISHWMKDWKT